MLGNYRTSDKVPSLARTPLTGATIKGIVVPTDDGYVPESTYLELKRLTDVIIGCCLTVVLLPVIAVMYLVVKFTSPGPGFYHQNRLGRLGKPFAIQKLRSMTVNAEQKGPQWSQKGDSRVTFVGKILRKLHIDEFPQLYNVLVGEMSIVGPRPERPEFFNTLSDNIPNYARRLLVRPGVTGLAQAYLPPDDSIDSVRLKTIYDLYYVRHISFWLDVKIVIATAVQVVGFPHKLVRWVLRLPHPSIIEAQDAKATPVDGITIETIVNPTDKQK